MQGETVTVTVTPDEGMQLTAGSLKANGTEISMTNGVYQFTMPGEDVTVPAAFEAQASTPGEEPGQEPGENPGEEPGENPGQEPGEKPDDTPDTGFAPLALLPLAVCAVTGIVGTQLAKKRR